MIHQINPSIHNNSVYSYMPKLPIIPTKSIWLLSQMLKSSNPHQRGGVQCHLKTCLPNPRCRRMIRVEDDCCLECAGENCVTFIDPNDETFKHYCLILWRNESLAGDHVTNCASTTTQHFRLVHAKYCVVVNEVLSVTWPLARVSLIIHVTTL